MFRSRLPLGLGIAVVMLCFLSQLQGDQRSSSAVQDGQSPAATTGFAAAEVWTLIVQNGTNVRLFVYENGRRIGNVNPNRDDSFRIRQKPRENVTIEIQTGDGTTVRKGTFFNPPEGGEATVTVR